MDDRRAAIAPVDVERREVPAEVTAPDRLAVHVDRHDLARCRRPRRRARRRSPGWRSPGCACRAPTASRPRPRSCASRAAGHRTRFNASTRKRTDRSAPPAPPLKLRSAGVASAPCPSRGPTRLCPAPAWDVTNTRSPHTIGDETPRPPSGSSRRRSPYRSSARADPSRSSRRPPTAHASAASCRQTATRRASPSGRRQSASASSSVSRRQPPVDVRTPKSELLSALPKLTTTSNVEVPSRPQNGLLRNRLRALRPLR